MRIGDLLEAQQLQLGRLVGGATRRQRRIVADTMRRLDRQLRRARLDPWGLATRESAMVLLGQGLRQMVGQQIAEFESDAFSTMALGQRHAASWLSTLDGHYHGAVTPLRFDTVEWLGQHSVELGTTRLREYSRSFQRYGAAAVSDIEEALASTILVGEPWTAARDRVARATRDVVGDKQWMVDRILKTEASTMYNGTQLAAMIEEDTDPSDPMLKRLVATFDSATGEDSVLLHGQTKPVKEPFFDSFNGISYMAPPNRPHDREVVVGWRKSYGDDIPFEKPPKRRALTKGPAVQPKRPKRPPRARTKAGRKLDRIANEHRRLSAEAAALERSLFAMSTLALNPEVGAIGIAHNEAVAAKLATIKREISGLESRARSLRRRRRGL